MPADASYWTPSLYMGLLPLLIGLSGWSLRSGNARQRWLSWIVLLATLASFGWYGLGWLSSEIYYLFAGQPPAGVLPGAPVGGLYWLMVVLPSRLRILPLPGQTHAARAAGCRALGGENTGGACSTHPPSRFPL